ncbi:MAG: hypothetical protein QM784_06130 [Polyangiaceae bacterium]
MRRPRAPIITTYYEELPQRAPVVSETNPDLGGAGEAASATTYHCDLCDKACEGEPSGKGLLLWWRGTEMRFDEPPLCEECSSRITLGAMSKWALEDEEEG